MRYYVLHAQWQCLLKFVVETNLSTQLVLCVIAARTEGIFFRNNILRHANMSRMI